MKKSFIHQTKLQQFFSFFIGTCLLYFSSCATVNKEKLNQIKSVAVVGFTLDQEDPTADKKVMDKITHSIYSEKVYNELVSNLKDKTNWTVLTTEALVKNPQVKSIYAKKDKLLDQLFKTNPPYVGQRRLEMKGIPQSYFIEGMSKEEISSLATALKVDAVVVVNLNVRKSIGHAMMMAQSGGDFKTNLIDAHSVFNVYEGINAEKVVGLQTQSGPQSAEEKSYKGLTSAMEIKSLKAIESVFARQMSSIQ